jgi:hypothetical protein
MLIRVYDKQLIVNMLASPSSPSPARRKKRGDEKEGRPTEYARSRHACLSLVLLSPLYIAANTTLP